MSYDTDDLPQGYIMTDYDNILSVDQDDALDVDSLDTIAACLLIDERNYK